MSSPEFGGRATNGWTFSDFIDRDGHGTLCASIVGGKQFGVAKNVRIVSVKVADVSEGKALTVNRIKGLQYVLEECTKGQHACIVSMSMGIKRGQDWTEILPQLNGKVKQAAAGNKSNDFFPSLAKVSGTITVAALDCHHRPARFSNYARVDIWAVGENIKALFNDNYWSMTEKKEWVKKINLQRNDYVAQGTSLAAPQVAGIIAIIISVHGNKPPADMKKMVIDMGIKDKIQGLRPRLGLPFQRFGPNVMAHIPKKLYSGGLAA
ncbi:hypothetical protein H0H93_006544 [Arthromyces matolae]|nr:hypothetical protein H0H93_006544 [Arthromyces matolae]